MNKKDIIDAWVWIRKNNNAIPDEVLDLMKDAAIEELSSHTPEEKGIDWMVMALLAEDMIIKRDNYKPVAKTFDELYLENKYPIHSVLRYDGVVFSVDDNTDRGFVYSFEIAGNEMIATFKGNGGFSNINFLSKPLQRTPLFKTEDGVDIFNGDDVWYCNTHEWVANVIWNLFEYPKQSTHKYFSNREKANEYLIMNKPCISVTDVLKLSSEYGINGLRKFSVSTLNAFAKQRLDKQ